MHSDLIRKLTAAEDGHKEFSYFSRLRESSQQPRVSDSFKDEHERFELFILEVTDEFGDDEFSWYTISRVASYPLQYLTFPPHNPICSAAFRVKDAFIIVRYVNSRREVFILHHRDSQ